MTLYSACLFLHIVGALGLFAGIGLEQAGLAGLRQARTATQLGEWVKLLTLLRRVEGPAAGLIVVTGLYLAVTGGRREAWVGLGLLGLLAMAGFGIGVTRPRVGSIARAMASAGRESIPSSLVRRLDDPGLRMAASLRAALGLGIVFLMAVKPGAPGAFATLGVALLAGVVIAMRSPWHRDPVTEP